MRAEALGILVANTQKALEELNRERKADEQAERVDNFVKHLTTDVNNMLTRFYFHKERKNMTDEQTRALVDFVNFVKNLTRNVQSLLARFQKTNGQRFEEKLDKEIKELEAHVKQRLKEYDEVLSGTCDTLKYRLSKYVGNKIETISKFFRRKSFVLEETEKAKLDGLQAYGFENTPLQSIDPDDPQLEGFINVLSMNTGDNSSTNSKRQIHLVI